MKLRLAHYRNRFTMFRIYYALGAGLIKDHGIDWTVIEVPDPPSRELEECLIRGDVDLANVYLPNFLERRLAGAPIIGLSHCPRSPGSVGTQACTRARGPFQSTQSWRICGSNY